MFCCCEMLNQADKVTDEKTIFRNSIKHIVMSPAEPSYCNN